MKIAIKSASILTVIASATLVIGACGETEIDEGKAEAEIAAGYEEQVPGSEVEGVDCPDEIGNEQGSTAVCVMTLADGSVGDIDVEVLDDEGNIRWDVANPVE